MKGRLDKLGVKPDLVVSILGVDDPTFEAEVRSRTSRVSVGRARQASDLVFLGASQPRTLDRLSSLAATIKPNGAVWVVWPKGRPSLREDDVRRTAIAAGLVDVKVVSFSDSLSGLKLVIPVAQREA